MALRTNDRGNLYLAMPRLQYGIGAAALAVLAVVCARWIATGHLGEWDAILPGWFRYFGLVACSAFALALAWATLRGHPLEFDAARQSLVRGTRQIATFAEIDHVELREVQAENRLYYRVSLRLGPSRRIDLGTQRSQVDASILAADVARLIGRPVRAIRR